MKNVALAIFVALLLTSSAFATNSMSQMNMQTASGTHSTIDQSAVNMGIQVGEGNKLVQFNGAFASVDNTQVEISNNPTLAIAIADPDMNNVWIKQCQANLGIQIGSRNDMSQKNIARADIDNVAIAIAKAVGIGDAIVSADATADANMNHVVIEQCQANLGIQVGKKNDMNQKNIANAEISNVAVAKAKAFGKLDINVIQSADADAYALGPTHKSKSNVPTDLGSGAEADSIATATAN